MSSAAVSYINQSHTTAQEEAFFPKKAELSRTAQSQTNVSLSAYWPALALILLQIMDGTLTFLGIAKFGLEAEGNPLLRNMMETLGCIPTLAISKLLSILFVLIIANLAYKISWARRALIFVSVIYTFFAVTPWVVILTLY